MVLNQIEIDSNEVILETKYKKIFLDFVLELFIWNVPP